MWKDLSPLIGTGPGRCGTQSLAQLLGGVHEPGPRGEKWRWPKMSMKQRRRYIKKHWAPLMRREIPLVDARCSFELEYIERMFEDTRVIALFRDPLSCIESMLSIWREPPKEGDLYRCVHVYNDSFSGLFNTSLQVEWYSMYDLPVVVDTFSKDLRQPHHRRVPVTLDREQKHMIFVHTYKTYLKVLKHYDEQRPRTFLQERREELEETTDGPEEANAREAVPELPLPGEGAQTPPRID